MRCQTRLLAEQARSKPDLRFSQAFRGTIFRVIDARLSEEAIGEQFHNKNMTFTLHQRSKCLFGMGADGAEEWYFVVHDAL